MVDMNMISGGLASLKAAKDIAEGLIHLRDTAKFQGAVVELQSKILSAQSDQFALMERVRELEAEKAKLEAWEAQKRRYQLVNFGGETFAYELRPDMSDGEPTHRICPACYEKQHRSILQYRSQTATGQGIYDCPACETAFRFGFRRE